MSISKAYLIKRRVNKKGLAPIYIRYTYNGESSGFPVSQSVEPEKFDDKIGLVKTTYKEAKEINLIIRTMIRDLEELSSTLPNPTFKRMQQAYADQLQAKKDQEEIEAKEKKKKDFVRKLDDVVDHYELEETEEQILQYQQKLNDLLSKRGQLNKKGYRIDSVEAAEFKRLLDAYPDSILNAVERTKGAIKTWRKILLEFAENTATVLTFDCFNQQFYNSYARYLMFGERNYYNSNFGKHVKQLKAFLRWCEVHHGKTVNRLYTEYKVLKEEKEIVFLSDEELDLLWNYRDKVSKDLVKHIDICVFQNLTGLRYSDVKRSYWEIDKGILKGKAKKNNGDYNVPLILDSRISEILEKYNYNMNLVSEQKYNQNIKVICKDLFEHHQINQKQIPIRRMKLREEFFERKFKWELLASHSNRRGFCSRMFHKGYSERDILLMLGSKSNEVLKKYIRNNTDDLMRKVKKLNGSKTTL